MLNHEILQDSHYSIPGDFDAIPKTKIFEFEGNVYVMRNVAPNYSNQDRNKVVLSKVNTDYTLTDIRTYNFGSGLQYYDVFVYN